MRSTPVVEPNPPLPNARFQATHCAGLLSGLFGHMLRRLDTRRLASGGRTANGQSTTIRGADMSRRNVLTQLAALPLMVAAGSSSMAAETKVPLKIMMKSAWGSDDPTKAAFPFLHGHALAEAGHTVQMFLLGEAVSLMRLSLAKAVVPVGWPPLEETMQKVVAKKIQIFACGACSRARGVTEADLAQWGAKFGNPTIFVSLVEWADRIITE
jgi:predicted peroxiredoxin